MALACGWLAAIREPQCNGWKIKRAPTASIAQSPARLQQQLTEFAHCGSFPAASHDTLNA